MENNHGSYPRAKLLKLAMRMVHDGDDYVEGYGRELLLILENQSSSTLERREPK